MTSPVPYPAPVLISAHRCGAGANTSLENTRTALDAACELPVEFVEFDVQRLGDGTLVCFHDDTMAVPGEKHRVRLSDMDLAQFESYVSRNGDEPNFLRYDTVLQVLAEAGKKAHIDYKFTSPTAAYRNPATTWEVHATQLAIDVLGVENIIVTTLEDATVRAVRDWADALGLDLLVGLSLGRSTEGLSRAAAIRMRAGELFPHRRYRASRANLVVVNHKLAAATVAKFAARRSLPMLVWTVNEHEDLTRWLEPGAAWLVTTNFPSLALEIRDAG